MIGEKLIPLNNLRFRDEELYKSYTKKYYDHPQRTTLLDRKIPKLNCLWNDVVHLLPVHPYHVYKSLSDVGVNVKSTLQFYKIPITNLKRNENVIYLCSKEHYNDPLADMNYKDVQFLDLDDFNELTSVPKDAKDYYEEQHNKGNPFGMFQFIPHILSLGKVNISNAVVIEWSQKPSN